MISLIATSRGSPLLLKRALNSAFDLARHPDELKATVRLDQDDPTLPDYLALKCPVDYEVGVRLGGSSKPLNEVGMRARGDILQIFADDVEFLTQGWDEYVVVELDRWFRDGIGLVYGNDGRKGECLCIHPALTRELRDLLGCVSPTNFTHYFSDTWVEDIVRRVGRISYMPHVYLRHWVKARDPLKDDAFAADKKLYDEGSAERALIAAHIKEHMTWYGLFAETHGASKKSRLSSRYSARTKG